jgi:hypothetical protein
MNEDNNNKEIIDVSKDEQIIEKSDLQEQRRPIYIRTLNVFTGPARRRYDKHYREKKHYLIIDVMFVIIIILLLITNVMLVLKQFDIPNIFVPKHSQVIDGPYIDANFYVNKEGTLPAKPGDELEYVLTFKNITSNIMEDVIVKVDLQGQAIDFESLNTQGDIDGNNIIWSSTQNESLTSLESNEEVSLSYMFKVKNNIPVSNPKISSQANISGIILNQIFEQDTDAMQIKVSSDLKISASYMYFTKEGEQLGFGAWPPVVGEETSVRVFVQPLNHLNRIKDVVVTMKLSDQIDWTDDFVVNSGEPLKFDSNIITWKIKELNTLNTIQSNFEIEFIPTNVNFKLLNNIQISGTDMFTGQKLEYNFGNLILKEVK